MNALVLNEVSGFGGLQNMRAYAPYTNAIESVAGRSGCVLTSNEKRICVAFTGIMSAAPLHSCGPKWMGYLQIRAGSRVRIPSASSGAVAQRQSTFPTRITMPATAFQRRGSQCGCSHGHRRSQVRILPRVPKGSGSSEVEHR